MDAEKPERKDRRGAPRGERPIDPATGRKQMGNPPFEPTPEQRDMVRTYAKVMSQEMIAAAFEPPIEVTTLRKYFRDELDKGKRDAVAAVGGKLLAKALSGNPTCMIFYLRTQGKWTTRLELTGPDGKPIETMSHEIDLSKLNEEELELYGRLAAKAAGIDPDGGAHGQSGVDSTG